MSHFVIKYHSEPNMKKILPVDTGRKLNVHKTFRRRPGRLLNVLCAFNLRPVSTVYGLSKLDFLVSSNMLMLCPMPLGASPLDGSFTFVTLPR